MEAIDITNPYIPVSPLSAFPLSVITAISTPIPKISKIFQNFGTIQAFESANIKAYIIERIKTDAAASARHRSKGSLYENP